MIDENMKKDQENVTRQLEGPRECCPWLRKCYRKLSGLFFGDCAEEGIVNTVGTIAEAEQEPTTHKVSLL